MLFGVGVTEAEVALAREDRRARAVGRAGRRLQQRLGGDLSTRSGSRAASPAAEDRQVPGLLQRLPRLRAAQRPEPPERRRRRDPHSRACSTRRSTRRSSAASTTSRTSSATLAAPRRARSRRSSSSRSPTTRRDPAPAAGLPRGPARALRPRGRAADLRRGHHRLPARPRRLPGDRRRHAGPDDARQGDRRTASRSPRSAGRRDHMERFNTTDGGDVHFGGTYNGNVAGRRGGARRRSSCSRHGGARARLPARRADARRAARSRRRTRASRRRSAGSARCSSSASWRAR